MARQKLTKSVVDRARPTERPDGTRVEANYWDSEVKSFGLRVTPGGAKTYVVMYRVGGGRRGRLRRYTIGAHGSPWTVIQARKEAVRLLGLVAAGEDPASKRRANRAAETMGELCDLYLARASTGEIRTRGGRPKRASTLYIDAGRIERHIKPLLGRKRVTDLTTQSIRSFIAAVERGDTATDLKTKARGRAIVKGGEGTAARTAGLLGGILTFAVQEGMRVDNPARGVERAKDRVRDRILSADEFRLLGAALAETDRAGGSPWAIAATKLLALTGMRRGEVLSLRRDAVDAVRRVVTLEESKTGRSQRPIGSAALAVIESLPLIEGSDFILPAERGTGHYQGLPRHFAILCDHAGLLGVTPHTLRHSFASVANEIGFAEPTIAVLLGHARHSTTSRYVHFIDVALLAAADKIANHIAGLMGIRPQGTSDRAGRVTGVGFVGAA